MIEITGERVIMARIERVWSCVGDMRQIVAAIPDTATVVAVDDRFAEIVLRPKLSFASGEMKLAIEKIAELSGQSSDWLLRSTGIGASSEVRAGFVLELRGDMTSIRWRATVEKLGGLLKLVPKSVIQASAQKVANDILTGIEAQIT